MVKNNLNLDPIFEQMFMNRKLHEEQHRNIMKWLEVKRDDPEVSFIVAMFKEMFVFKDMTYSYLSQYRHEVSSLKQRVEWLESKLNSENEDKDEED